jgi:hypothetical protein
MAKRTRAEEWMARFNSYRVFESNVVDRRRAENVARIAGIEGYEYDQSIPKEATVPGWIKWCISNWIWYYTRHQIDRLICWRRGHEVVDIRVAHNDSGDGAWECKRCGASGRVNLY